MPLLPLVNTTQLRGLKPLLLERLFAGVGEPRRLPEFLATARKCESKATHISPQKARTKCGAPGRGGTPLVQLRRMTRSLAPSTAAGDINTRAMYCDQCAPASDTSDRMDATKIATPTANPVA